MEPFPLFLKLRGRPCLVVRAGRLPARNVPARKLKVAIAAVAIFGGPQLIWSGTGSLLKRDLAPPQAAAQMTRP